MSRADLVGALRQALESALQQVNIVTVDLSADELTRVAELVADDKGLGWAVAKICNEAIAARTAVQTHESPNVPAENAPDQSRCKCADARCGHCRKDHVFGGQCTKCGCWNFI